MTRPQTTVLDALAQRLASDPDGLYLDFEGDVYTARAMDAASTRLAHRSPASGSGTATASRRCSTTGPSRS